MQYCICYIQKEGLDSETSAPGALLLGLDFFDLWCKEHELLHSFRVGNSKINCHSAPKRCSHNGHRPSNLQDHFLRRDHTKSFLWQGNMTASQKVSLRSAPTFCFQKA